MNPQAPHTAIPTSRRFKIATDLYLQRFIKYPKIAECHCYVELLYLALLEFNPTVSSFTPQPKKLKINGRRYVPDCFFLRDGEKTYVELKPRGEFGDALRLPLEQYARRKNCKFEVVANEAVLERRVRAENALQMLRVLLSASDEDTSKAEEDIFDQLFTNRSMDISDVVDRDNRIGERHMEIALYKLAHSGAISIDIDKEPIGYRTKVRYLHWPEHFLLNRLTF